MTDSFESPQHLGAEALAIADEIDAIAQRATELMAELVDPWVRRFGAAQAAMASQPYATKAERQAAANAFYETTREELVMRGIGRLQELVTCMPEHSSTSEELAAWAT